MFFVLSARLSTFFAPLSDLAPLPVTTVQQDEAVKLENKVTASPVDIDVAENADEQNQEDANEQDKVIETGGNADTVDPATRL